MAIAEEPVLVERDGELATVILNRPAKLNAMNRDDGAPARRRDECARRGRISEVRAPARQRQGLLSWRRHRRVRGTAGLARRGRGIRNLFPWRARCGRAVPASVVAIIRGACVGGGLQLAALCDLRIASESARFGIPVNRIGLTVDYSELAPIYRLIGEGPLLEILLEGRVFSAAEARGKGLVSRVVPDDRLDQEAILTARRIADGAPLVNRWHKKFVRRLSDPRPISKEEMRESFLCFDTKDYLTGYQAFLSKTKPVWEGR